jgi:hypothetical protein
MRFIHSAGLLAAAGVIAASAQHLGYQHGLKGHAPGMHPHSDYVPTDHHYMSQENALLPLPDIQCQDSIVPQAGTPLAPFINIGPVPLTFTNGSCHILAPGRTQVGNSFRTHVRLVESGFTDGRGAIPMNRPSARLISNTVIRQPDGLDLNIKGASRLLIFFGQFIDHDFALVLEQPETPDVPAPTFPRQVGAELLSEIPPDEDVFIQEGRQLLREGDRLLMIFPRSLFVVDQSFRKEFVSVLTPWLDLSQVYGDTINQTNALRLFSGGLMLTQQVNGVEFMPPGPNGMGFRCGDIRCPENTMLFAWHVVWLRNHNFWARTIPTGIAANLNDPLVDEYIFQHARVRNIAEYQYVLWEQYLPYLLGRRTFAARTEPYMFDPNQEPTCSLVFTTAIFRYGHSGVSNDLQFMDEGLNQVRTTLPLALAFFNPGPVMVESSLNVARIFIGQGAIAHDILDSRVQSGIRDRLFANNQMFAPGFDLTARNINRGRDHGLGTYNDYRVAAGLAPRLCPNDPRDCFNQLTANTEVANNLFNLYGDINNCDIWPCGMAEDSLEDSLLGETFTFLMADQFNRMRESDRTWYLNLQTQFTNLFNLNGVNAPANLQFPVGLNEIVNRNGLGNGQLSVPEENLFMVDRVWLAFANQSVYNIEWFTPPVVANNNGGVQQFVITDNRGGSFTVTPGGGPGDLDTRDNLLMVLRTDARPNTQYTVTVNANMRDGSTQLIGTVSFRTPRNPNRLGGGAIAGIVIGSVVGAAILIGAVAFFVSKRKTGYTGGKDETFL